MKLPRAMLIDLDDTLICFDGVARESWIAACEVYKEPSPTVEELVDEIWAYAHWYYSDPGRHREGRNNLEETRRMVVREAFRRIAIDDPETANRIGDRYTWIRSENLYLFPMVKETLTALRERGLRLCLVTNGEAHLQRRKIERFGLDGFFDGIFIEGERGYGKPDERIFRDALETAGCGPEEAWIVGDNWEWEIAAPKELGMTCIWRDKRGNGPPDDTEIEADAVIDQFSEILSLISRAERL